MKHERTRWLGILSLVIFCSSIPALRTALGHHQDKLNPLLIAAVQNDDAGSVRLLLAQGANPNTRLPLTSMDGRPVTQAMRDSMPTVLSTAAGRGFGDVVKALLDGGADVNASENAGATPLFGAVTSGNMDCVKLLVAKGARVNTQFAGSPLLSAVIMDGNMDMLKYLLDHGADANAADRFGITPLMHAIMLRTGGDHLDMIRLLLAKGADPGKGGQSGFNAFSIAARLHRTDIEELLRSSGAKLSLTQAATIGDVAALRSALDRGADIDAYNDDGHTALMLASLFGKSDTAKLLLDRGAKPNLLSHPKATQFTANIVPPGSYALVMAAGAGYTDIVKMLLDKGADINAQAPAAQLPANPRFKIPTQSGDTALTAAARMQHADTVALLLDRGVDLKAGGRQGGRALTYALSGNRRFGRPVEPGHTLPAANGRVYGSRDLVSLLMEHGPDLKTDGADAVVRAAGMEDSTTLQALLARGANPNALGQHDMTPLLQALDFGLTDNVKLLLEKGADVNVGSREGFTPLMRAVLSEDDVTVPGLFIAHGAHVNAKFSSEDSVLALAGLHGNTHICGLLLAHGADVNAQNAEGRTVLMQTIDDGTNARDEQMQRMMHPPVPPKTDAQRINPEGHLDTVSLLLRHDAKVNVKSKDGMTALKLAIDGRFPKVVRLLKQAGAKL